ncbi:VWA domain-containing protein [Rhodoferax sp. 4810]|uniref:VWA domain-containing protein n=1 Tax=Thiospirillum jenense TaxID=1653858 RepID=A0A839HFX4_9GAMM|nr:TerY-C metal binding domain-containing protein [Thiospirillum jenense]MBB1076146.1 VWA domain-containing protein [Rhodoferax jenense]MBB1126068.1 VWA domain-containing protein [Thiospirillum jenense]
MRRLPVFFVLDCSESMVGDKLKKMEDGLQAIVRNLRSDPHALETVYLSIIAFAGIAKTIVPLVELVAFYPPRLPLGGGTSLGAALNTLMDAIDNTVIKTAAERKGDWKPIIYLFTDGHPTDDPEPMITRWKQDYAQRATFSAIGIGKDADFSVLKCLTNNVFLFEDSRPDDFTTLIRWVSTSLVAQSRSLGEDIDLKSLPLFDERVMQIIKDTPMPLADESCVTLVGRCQKTRRPYLMKYEREIRDLAGTEFAFQVALYQLAGCYPLDEEYFAWSDLRDTDLKVNSSSLIGAPGCPHCGNMTGFALCGCGKLLCVNGAGEATCPWCGRTVDFSPGTPDEEGGFEVNRSKG